MQKKAVAFEITFDTDKVLKPKPRLSSRQKNYPKTNSTTINKSKKSYSTNAKETTILKETVLPNGQRLKVYI